MCWLFYIGHRADSSGRRELIVAIVIMVTVIIFLLGNYWLVVGQLVETKEARKTRGIEKFRLFDIEVSLFYVSL